ncbi:MAG: M12 family metallo-peptidase [Myxococcales bacterium]
MVRQLVVSPSRFASILPRLGLLCALLLAATGCDGDSKISPGAAPPPADAGTSGTKFYEVELDGRMAVLELVPNEGVLAKDYREYMATSDGLEEMPTPGNRTACMFRGGAAWADGADSTGPRWSALNTCAGFQGLIALDGETFILAPGGADNEVLVSRLSEGANAPVTRARIRLIERAHGTVQGLTAALVTPTRYLELVVVSDAARFEALGMDAMTDAVQIANLTDAIYRNGTISPAVAIVVTANVVIPGGTDPWTVPPSGDVDPSVVLTNFSGWARTHLLKGDEHFLLTQRELTDATVGLTYVSAACKTFKQGMVQATFPQAITATTLAHELGHSLGMSHDGSSASCPSGPWIMAPNVSTPPATTWSACSGTALASYVASLGSPGCLDNVPVPDTTAPTCGDGFRDPGEHCDCGSNDCTGFDPCCNGLTCQLVAGASCSQLDGCCNNCQVAPQGTTCEAATVCSPAAVCSGTSSACPKPAPFANGSACAVAGFTDGVCFQGQCESLGQQCDDVRPGSVPCGTGCDALPCRDATYGCVDWLVEAQDGTRCGSGRQCDQGSCVLTSTLALCAHDLPTNACGGCSSLAVAPGTACNTCGVMNCVSPSEVRCSVANASACPNPNASPVPVGSTSHLLLVALALLAMGGLGLSREFAITRLEKLRGARARVYNRAHE